MKELLCRRSHKKELKREIKKNTMEKKQKIHEGTIRKGDARPSSKLKNSTHDKETISKEDARPSSGKQNKRTKSELKYQSMFFDTPGSK